MEGNVTRQRKGKGMGRKEWGGLGMEVKEKGERERGGEASVKQQCRAKFKF